MEQPRLEFAERAATLQALRAAVETGEVPETGAADNVRSLAVVLGCVEAVEGGGRVDVAGYLAAGRGAGAAGRRAVGSGPRVSRLGGSRARITDST